MCAAQWFSYPSYQQILGRESRWHIVSSSTHGRGIIEIKNMLHSKPINLWQASEYKNFCLENVNGKLLLKKNHMYFYQSHGLLNISNTEWIDFIVRTLNPHHMFIQRIYRVTFGIILCYPNFRQFTCKDSCHN